jgi:hypothetical protein
MNDGRISKGKIINEFDDLIHANDIGGSRIKKIDAEDLY